MKLTQSQLKRIIKEELNNALNKAIEQLSPVQKEVLLLRKQGIPFKDIADIQQTSINTVLGRMHYAVKKLKTLLREW